MKKRKDFHDYYSSSGGGFLFRWVDFKKIRVIRKEVADRSNLRILDIGCGAGFISSKFVKRNAVFGVDINRKLVAHATSSGIAARVVSPGEKLPFNDGFFDIILIIDSIEHFDNPDVYLSESKRLLKKKGCLIIFTPPYDSCSWLFAELFHNILTRSASDHISPFTKESMALRISKYFNSYTIKKMNLGLTMCCWARK